MAATGSEMEVVVVAQIASYLKGMQEANAVNMAAMKSINELLGGFKQLPGAINPAGRAIEGAAEGFKAFKREQVQEGRMYGWYVRETIAFTGASAHAQEAIGGLTQGIVGLFTATGPLLYAWAGFEIVKSVAGYFMQAGEAAKKAADEAIASSMKIQDTILQLNAVLSGADSKTFGSGSALSAATTKYQELLRLRRIAESFDSEAAGTSGNERKQAEVRAKEMWDAYGKRGGNQEMERLAIEMAREAAEAAQGEEKKSITTSLGAWKEAGKQRLEDAKKVAEDLARQQNEVFKAGLKLDEENLKAWNQRMAKEAAEQGLQDAMDPSLESMAGLNKSPAEIFKEADKNTQRAVQGQIQLAKALDQAWQDVGAAMAGAFNMLGNAIGGAAGKFLSTIGEMISQAIKFAIAMAAASVAQTPVIGGFMAAAAAIGLATSLVATIASVPSYDVGTSYVPRTGLAMIHKGEAIVTAEDNARGAGRGSNVNVTLNVTAMDGRDVYRTLTGSRSQLARVVREAVRDGVM